MSFERTKADMAVTTGNSACNSTDYECHCKQHNEQEQKREVKYGWVCPLCGRVNAPWVEQCECYKELTSCTCKGAPIEYSPYDIDKNESPKIMLLRKKKI